MNRVLERHVRARAAESGEYCRMPQPYDELTFEIEHIIARQHGGKTASGNLALACFPCNHRKGPSLAGIDPRTGRLTALFHPRRHKWLRHFRWEGAVLAGRTAIGRTTIAVLAITHPRRVRLRQTLIEEGCFPPA